MTLSTCRPASCDPLERKGHPLNNPPTGAFLPPLQVSKLRSDVAREEDRVKRLEQESEGLRGELDECQAERDALREELRGFESKVMAEKGVGIGEEEGP